MNPIQLKMPIPKEPCCSFPFFTTLGTSLGLLYDDPVLMLSDSTNLWGGLSTVPFVVQSAGSHPANTTLYAIPNPFGDRTLPTIYVGGAPENFVARNPIEQYLQAFKYLSWPEQLKLYQVAGANGRDILSTSGVCPQFSNLTPAVLLDL